MKYRLKLNTLILIGFVVALFGCQSVPSINIPSPTASPAQTAASTSTPSPTAAPAQTSTPRWVEYERALSRAVVQTSDGLCEWEILGTAGDEVYVWAECRIRGPVGSAGSVPAVIQLGKNGKIEAVKIPRDGSYYPIDVKALFPADLQENIFIPTFDGPAAEKHMAERLNTNGPPFIVINETPLP